MREIRTFILRLLVDTNEPQNLRGGLRAVVDDEEHSFTDDQTLLALLHSMGHTTGKYLKEGESKESSPRHDNRQR